MPLALLQFEVKSVSMEVPEDFPDLLAMSSRVGGVDQYVLEVDHDAHIQHTVSAKILLTKGWNVVGALVRLKGITNHSKEP